MNGFRVTWRNDCYQHELEEQKPEAYVPIMHRCILVSHCAVSGDVPLLTFYYFSGDLSIIWASLLMVHPGCIEDVAVRAMKELPLCQAEVLFLMHRCINAMLD